jgi:fibronectin-binding autotransporter adhesin
MKDSIPQVATPDCAAPRGKHLTNWTLALASLVQLAVLATNARAASITKANNADNLIQGSSWVGGTAPGSADIAQWDSTVTSANATVLGADTNWAGIKIAGPGGAVTINAGNTLTIGTSGVDMTAATADLTLNCGVTLGAAESWTNQLATTVTVNGIVGGAVAWTKKGEGTLVLNGTNAHSSTTIGDGNTKSGVISVGNSSGLGANTTTMNGTGLGAIWLSGGVIIPNALTPNGALGNGITAYGNIRNLSGYNKWTGLITGNASPRVGCDSGTLEITSGGFTLGSTARGPNFVGPGDFLVSAPVRKFTSGSALNFLTKSLGTGTLRLSAANTYTGSTTLISGTTMLDFGSVANVLDNTSVLSLQGGTLTLSGGSAAEVVASTSIAGGGSAVTRSSGSSTLRMNVITRTAGATVDFGTAGVADTDTANVNGILGGYATLGAADWAVNSTGGADGPITAYTAYQTATAPASWAAADNVTLAGNPSANVPSKAINSLRLTAASAVTIDTGATLTNSSGGVLVTGSGATSIVGADSTAGIVGGNSADLIVHQNSSADCTISAVIGDNTAATRLTKSGPGKLILSGANKYTGSTFLNGGTLSISANNNLGDAVTGAAVVFNGATLQATASFALENAGANKRQFTMNDFTTSTVDVTGANVLTFSGLFSGRGWLAKTGTGTLTITGAQTTYQGDILINGGSVVAGVAEVAGTSGPFGNQATGATVSGVSCFLHFGGGTLQYSNGVNNADYSFRFSPDAGQAYSVDTAGTNVTWASALNSSGGSLAKAGAGTLTLTAANTYNGRTTISAGAVALSGSGAINNSSVLSLAAGATFDVSALTSPYNLSSSTTLSASGTGTTVGTTAAAITNATGGTVNLGTRPITLAYDGSNPALYVLPGTLQVQGNAWTINGSALSPSTTYTIASQNSGTASVSGTHTVYGTAILGMTGTIAGSGANVQLTTSAALTGTTTSVASSANPSTYGAGPTLTATVSSASASGTVLFVLDGVPQLPAVTVSSGTAAFTAPIAIGAGVHTVVAQYSGDGTFGSSVSTTFNQTVAAKALTMTGLSVPASRAYDGTALAYVSGVAALQAPEAFGAGSTSDGKPYTGDAVGIIGLALGTYDSKDVASATTVNFSGLRLIGAQAANYSLTMQTPAAATITTKALTVASPAVTGKLYDGTAAATLTGSLQAAEFAGTGTSADGKPFAGDGVTLNLSGTFNNKNVGTNKTVTSTSTLGGAQAGDYSLTQPGSLTGNITKTNLTVTAAANTKTYDGTTSAAATPAVTSGSIQPGDTGNFTETYNTKHVGTSKTLTPAGSVTDGNSGTNYNVTLTSANTGTINQTNISVTAATNTKGYDGNTSAAAVPTVTSGTIQPGDTPNFTETYDNPNVGTGKTLTPTGSVTDGNGGANYDVGFFNNTTGVITNTTPCSSTNALLSISDNLDGTFTLKFQGTVQAQYYVVSSAALTVPTTSWPPLAGSTNTVTNLSGLWQITVTNTAAQRFYRSAAVTPCP